MVKSNARRYEVWTLAERGAASRTPPKFVLVLQSWRLDELATVIVAPLISTDDLPAFGRARPQIIIDKEPYLIVFDRMAIVDRRALVTLVMDASHMEWQFKTALDEVFF